jgi:hypothetical protein
MDRKENETLGEKYARMMDAIEEYTIKVDKMLADVDNTTPEELEQVRKELQVMYDESVEVEEEVRILRKLTGE